MLTSLKRELYESEQYSLLLKVFEIEKRLVIFEKGKQIQLKPALIANEERGILKKKKLLVHYHQLYLQIESLQPQNYKEAEEFLQEPILINQIDVLGLLEQVFVLKCRERLYTLLKKNDDAKKCAVKMRELFVKHTFLYDHFINQLDLDLE
jgi:hypothetical protein